MSVCVCVCVRARARLRVRERERENMWGGGGGDCIERCMGVYLCVRTCARMTRSELSREVAGRIPHSRPFLLSWDDRMIIRKRRRGLSDVVYGLAASMVSIVCVRGQGGGGGVVCVCVCVRACVRA